MELTPRPGTPGARGAQAFERAFDNGVLLRVTGDTIAVAPPLIATEDDIATIAGTLGEVLKAVE